MFVFEPATLYLRIAEAFGDGDFEVDFTLVGVLDFSYTTYSASRSALLCPSWFG